MNKPECFGHPDPRLLDVCGSCGVRAECFRRQADMEDVFFLIRPKSPAPEAKRPATRYAEEKYGAKPWEREKKDKGV